jgi:hypothetical protein
VLAATGVPAAATAVLVGDRPVAMEGPLPAPLSAQLDGPDQPK